MTSLFNSMRDLHEHLTYFSKPEDKDAISKIQLYLNYFLNYSKLVNALNTLNEQQDDVISLSIDLKLNDMTYTENTEGIADAINQLAEADGFELEVRYSGRNGDLSAKLGEGTLLYPDVVNNYYGMFEYLENSSDRNLGYIMMAYYEDHDEFAFKYIDAEGCIDNCLDECGTVTETGKGYDLCPTNNFSILASFDFEKYSSQAESLKKLISEYITDKEVLDSLKELWDEGEYIGFADLSDGCLSLDNLIDFIDDFNDVLKDIDDEDLNVKTAGVLYDFEKFIAVNPFYYEKENKIRVNLVDF